MPNACPACRGYYNLQYRLPFNGIPVIECGDCGWAGEAEELDWVPSGEAEE